MSFTNKIITIRYIDPPLHEFLPIPGSAKYEEEITCLASTLGIDAAECKARSEAFREKNPSNYDSEILA